MISKTYMGGGALFLAVAIVVAQMLGLTGTLSNLWAYGIAAVVAIWGVITLMNKSK